MTQTVLPFKLEMTAEEITAQAGLALMGEYLAALGLAELVDGKLPGPGSAAGYRASEYALPVVLMLTGGGRSLEDLRELRQDTGLRSLLGWRRLPSTDAVGDWLRRLGAGEGLAGLAAVNREVLAAGLRAEEETEYTLDLDATGIAAEKAEAQWTYKGFKGYMPLVGHLAENGLVVGEEFREGNESPGARNLEFIKYCVAQMPEGKRMGFLRADSASYQAAVFNYCEEHQIQFAIGADWDAAVQAAVAAIPESEWRPYQNGGMAETVHCMNATARSFRLIVVRRPAQLSLFGEDPGGQRYTVIASNRQGETAEETLAWYNQRGESSENRIKELKLGFGMERMPCGQFLANAVWFRLGVLAYNLFKLFGQRILPAGWRRHQVQTLRWRLYQTAGKIVYHAGRIYLKVRRYLYGLFKDIRLRIWEYAQA